jgi:hypothetical protein
VRLWYLTKRSCWNSLLIVPKGVLLGPEKKAGVPSSVKTNTKYIWWLMLQCSRRALSMLCVDKVSQQRVQRDGGQEIDGHGVFTYNRGTSHGCFKSHIVEHGIRSRKPVSLVLKLATPMIGRPHEILHHDVGGS